MKRKADNLRMPNDKTRMDILLNHVDHFCIHPNVAALSLQLLAAITISNDVLREVLDGFFHKERTESRFLETALSLLLNGLLLCPNGELLNKVMNFWIKLFLMTKATEILFACWPFWMKDQAAIRKQLKVY